MRRALQQYHVFYLVEMWKDASIITSGKPRNEVKTYTEMWKILLFDGIHLAFAALHIFILNIYCISFGPF